MLRHLGTALGVGIVAALGAAAPVQAADQALDVTVKPKRFSAGKIPLGSTVEPTITVTNTGTEPVYNQSFTWLQTGGSGGFTAVNFDRGTCGEFEIVLAPGESCTWSVELTAGNLGRVTGELCFVAEDLARTTSESECTRFSGVIKPR